MLLDANSLSDIDSNAGRSDSGYAKEGKIWLDRAQEAGVRGIASIPWRALLLKLGLFLLPSFVQSRLSRDPRTRGGAERKGPTAYLDGIRGWGAFAVFGCHYFYQTFDVAHGWGFEDSHYQVWKLPFIRLIYSGPSGVCAFFVISGYALTYRPLKLARARNFEGFNTALSSLVFRRAFRLYVPTLMSNLLIVILCRIGLLEWTRDIAEDATLLTNVREDHLRPLATTSEQLAQLVGAMNDLAHRAWTNENQGTPMDPHVWSIPFEYRNSMVMFTSLLAVARLRTPARLAVIGLSTYWHYYNSHWTVVLFYAGMLFAELDLIRGAHVDSTTTASISAAAELPGNSEPVKALRRRRLASAFWIGLSIVGLYFLSQPDFDSVKTPGWRTLMAWFPESSMAKGRVYQVLGAIVFIGAAGRVPGWQRFFCTPVMQYLGRISYSIYLMHNPVIHTVGYAAERWAWGITGVETQFAREVGFALSMFITVPCVIWASDVFMRAVDQPTVKFAKWVETKCSIAS